MTKELLDKLHACQVEILDVFVEICDKYNLKYYLNYGTLIGVIRHKGFIPWDDDIDVTMPLEDYNKFIKIAQSELGDKYFLQNAKTDKHFGRCFSKIRKNGTAFYGKGDKNKKKHHGIFIDVFPLFYSPESLRGLKHLLFNIGRSIDRFLIAKCDKNKVSKRDYIWYIFPRCFLVNLRRKIFNMKHGDRYCDWDFVYSYDIKNYEDYLGWFEGKQYRIPKGYDHILRTIYGDYMQLPPMEKRVARYPEIIRFDQESE